MAIKKLTQKQTMILIAAGVAIFLGFGAINLIQVNKKPSKKTKAAAQVPDPGAEARKKYQEEKQKEAAANGGQVTGSLVDDSGAPPIEAPAPAGTKTPTPTKRKKGKSNNDVVSADSRGEISGVLPSGSILTEAPVEVAAAPTISAPKDDVGRKVVDTPISRINTSQVTPGIPTGLLDQTPPEMAQRSQQALIPARIEIRPGRYLFNNLTDDALRSPSIKYQSGGISYNLDKFAPQGEVIDVVLMHNAASEQSDIPVSAAVWTPFYFQGHRVLNTGDKLLGRAQKGKKDRLMITFDKVIFKDGRSTAINAVGMDTDGTAGIQGYMVGDALIQALGGIITEAAGDILQGVNSSVQQSTTQSVYYGGIGVNGSNTGNEVQGDIVSALGDAAIKANQKIQEVLKQEQEENKPYVLVPAGTRARALLMAPFDPTNADYGK